jgi:hypothetical protein
MPTERGDCGHKGNKHTPLKKSKKWSPPPLDGLFFSSAYVAEQELAGYRILGRVAGAYAMYCA